MKKQIYDSLTRTKLIFFRRHRCPHRPSPSFGSDKPCMLTEYATTYHPHPLQKEKNFKPADNAQGSGEPLSDKTTNRLVKKLGFTAKGLYKFFVIDLYQRA